MKEIGILKDGGVVHGKEIELNNGRKFTSDLQYNATSVMSSSSARSRSNRSSPERHNNVIHGLILMATPNVLPSGVLHISQNSRLPTIWLVKDRDGKMSLTSRVSPARYFYSSTRETASGH